MSQKTKSPKLISIPEWFKDCNVEEYEGNILQCLHLFTSQACYHYY
jgi:hypothetical protein